MQQAEFTAINLIEQEFARLSTLTEVGIIVSGERDGQEVPLLSTKVSRLNWQAKPNLQSWTNYFTKAAILLGFYSPQKIKPSTPRSSVVSSSTRSIIESDPGFRDD